MKEDLTPYRKWAAEKHREVNHYYDDYDYVLHLNAVEAAHQEFKDELDTDLDNNMISKACWAHDLEEDCRQTYNDIKKIIGIEAADIVHALTNNKGRTRAERANKEYYLNIRQTPGASFVKMCDRIANVRYSRLMGSSMYKKYREENPSFMKQVDADRFPRMKETLINLFK